jgi:hypothetical protein
MSKYVRRETLVNQKPPPLSELCRERPLAEVQKAELSALARQFAPQAVACVSKLAAVR